MPVRSHGTGVIYSSLTGDYEKRLLWAGSDCTDNTPTKTKQCKAARTHTLFICFWCECATCSTAVGGSLLKIFTNSNQSKNLIPALWPSFKFFQCSERLEPHVPHNWAACLDFCPQNELRLSGVSLAQFSFQIPGQFRNARPGVWSAQSK